MKLSVLVLLLAFIPNFIMGREARETARIEHLLKTVESMVGASFIRSGSEYDPKAAAQHLRMKLDKAGERVQTAEDFIEGCATRSYLTGDMYKIRLPNGTTVESGKFLREKLQAFDPSKN